MIVNTSLSDANDPYHFFGVFAQRVRATHTIHLAIRYCQKLPDFCLRVLVLAKARSTYLRYADESCGLLWQCCNCYHEHSARWDYNRYGCGRCKARKAGRQPPAPQPAPQPAQAQQAANEAARLIEDATAEAEPAQFPAAATVAYAIMFCMYSIAAAIT